MSNKIKKIYHAAIYVRLSKEDGDIANSSKVESDSISNQKDLIKDFLKDKKDIKVVSERVDDGFSGSNFERPAFQLMLEDIKKGIVDCVIVKDLSRFGREYIDAGRYIEKIFPSLGVRFISINDNYDSAGEKSQSDEIIIPFKNLINDAYCSDISIKIRSQLEIKRKNGEYISAFVPYGYMKAEDDRHKIVPDTYSAEVVKDIFKMKLHGMSQDAIANKLNDSGILSPMEYKKSLGSNYQTSFKINEQALWSSVTVRRVLENEVYIGNLVQGKQSTPNHKVKQTFVKPEEEWIRIKKNHEAIITDRDFEIVQRLLGMDTRTAPDQDGVYVLAGIAVCADCGSPMARKVSTVCGKKYAYYICSNHKETKDCSSHRIPVKDLENGVLELLRQHIYNVLDLTKVMDFIGKVPFQKLDIKRLEERLHKKEAEIVRCKDLKVMLYEDMKEGIVSKKDYSELYAAYETKCRDAEENVRKIRLEIEKIVNSEDDKHKWIEYFTQYKDIQELSRIVVVELISEIRVFDKHNIEIVFDFDDCYRELLNQFETIEIKDNTEISRTMELVGREAV